MIFYKKRPYHYWIGARQMSDWYEVGLKELSSTKITAARMRVLKNGYIKGLVYVKCTDVIPIMRSSLRDVLSGRYGEARPACTREEWEEAIPVMEKLCRYFAYFLIRLLQNYLYCTCYLQSVLTCLLNIPPVKYISLNHTGECCSGATALCDYCLFHKAVQNYSDLSISDLDIWNMTYIPQFQENDIPRLRGNNLN